MRKKVLFFFFFFFLLGNDESQPDDLPFKNLSVMFANYPIDYRIFHI